MSVFWVEEEFEKRSWGTGPGSYLDGPVRDRVRMYRAGERTSWGWRTGKSTGPLYADGALVVLGDIYSSLLQKTRGII